MLLGRDEAGVASEDESTGMPWLSSRFTSVHDVCTCLCLYGFVCMYACLYVCMCMYVSMYVFMYVCMYLCMSVWMSVRMHVCMYGYMYMYVLVGTYGLYASA